MATVGMLAYVLPSAGAARHAFYPLTHLRRLDGTNPSMLKHGGLAALRQELFAESCRRMPWHLHLGREQALTARSSALGLPQRGAPHVIHVPLGRGQLDAHAIAVFQIGIIFLAAQRRTPQRAQLNRRL